MKKICAKCKKLLELSQFNKHKKSPDGLQYYCKGCIYEARKKWEANNPERKKEKWREWARKVYLKNPERLRERVRKYQKSHPEKMKEYQKRKGLKLRMGALEAYGKKCTCCGESTVEFLAIDHKNGGGGKHRKEINGNFYRWLRVNKYPVGFQTLCNNCNWAKYHYGECPHKRIRDGNGG